MKYLLLFVYTAGLVYGQNEIPQELEDIGNKVKDIPGFENFDPTNVPSLEEAEDIVKKKCEKNGGKDAFDKLDRAKDDLQACITYNFNLTQIDKEVEKAKGTGSMDEVFAKYCNKKQVVFDCIKNLTDTVEACLEEAEKENMKLILNVTDSLANFVCFKDGDRIAMFVAEGGVECLDSRKEGIQKCANDTLGHRIPQDLNTDTLPLLLIGSQECSEFSNLQKCVVDELEKCSDNTPANIVDALFKFIRRVTPCKNHPVSAEVTGDRRFTKGSSNAVLYSNILLIITLSFSRLFV